jgi:hypothetical protein
MRTIFQSILTEILVVIMLLTGTFPTWAVCTIIVIMVIQFIVLGIQAAKKANLFFKSKGK